MRMTATMPAEGAELRARVQRLLRGDIREHDLHRLFYYMREEGGDSGLVAEVAHFLAHPGGGDRGLATQEVRDFFAFLRFRLPLSRNPDVAWTPKTKSEELATRLC